MSNSTVSPAELEASLGVNTRQSGLSEPDAYARAVEAQLRQYPNARDMHALPPIFGYWAKQHLKEKLRGIVNDSDKFFAIAIVEAVARTGIQRVISVGAGDAAQEIKITKDLWKLGRSDVEILCFDLSPGLVAQATANISAAGLAGQLQAIQIDLNKGFTSEAVAAVIAVDSLHHMLNLEGLFEAVEAAIDLEGSFILRDVIGRNGHMRWPEVLEPLRAIWPRLPLRLRYDHQKQAPDLWFENFDCSVEGFEGIRSQDIMGLLAERFDFSRLLTYGGLVDVFIDRSFGPNFDPRQEEDRRFIDSLQLIEDRLTAAGVIFPTQIFAEVRRRGKVDRPDLQAAACRAVRDPAYSAPPVSLVEAGLVIPYPKPADTPVVPVVCARLTFAEGELGVMALRWGWHAPERKHVWSYREDSAIALRIEGLSVGDALVFETIGNVIEELGPQVVVVELNGHLLGRIIHNQAERVRTPFVLRPEHLADGVRNLVLRFACSYSRRPDRDGGPDKRAVGFALLGLKLHTQEAQQQIVGLQSQIAERQQQIVGLQSELAGSRTQVNGTVRISV